VAFYGRVDLALARNQLTKRCNQLL